MKLEEYSCGLDFGTSNSVISITDKQTRKEVFTCSESSILFFPPVSEQVYYVGKEAHTHYVASEMQGRLLKSVKTLLRQDKFLSTNIYGKKMTPDQLVTCIIRYLKEKAEAFLGEEITDVVLGRPAIFSEDPKQEALAVSRLMLGAQNAGFRNVRLQLEPIAAAFSYEERLAQDENVLVADFGGGTSDFTIMRLSPDRRGNENRKEDIIAHGGVYIGGDMFDSEIMWHKVTPQLGRGVTYESYGKAVEVPAALYREMRYWERSFMLKESKLRRSMDSYYIFSGNNPKIDHARVLIDHNLIFSLFKKIEKAKMELSVQEDVLIEFAQETIDIRENFTQTEFEALIGRHTAEIERYMVGLLHSAAYRTEDIDSVFITGGSSLVVPIREILYRVFGKEKVRTGDTFNSVAYGLSLSY